MSALGRVRYLAFGVSAAALALMLSETCAAQSRRAGCQVSGARTDLLEQTSTDGRQVVRRYLLQVPKSYDAEKAYPVVFVFHGKGGTAEQSRSWGLQDAKGAAESAIFVFPQGVMFRDYGVGWDDGNHGYDVPFFDHMLRDVEASYCVDEAEVFVAGFSWGGDFVTSLACNRGDKIRAMAVNSASDDYGDKADYKTYRGLPCPSRVQPAIRFEHAVERDGAYPPPDFATTSKLYQTFDRCTSASKAVPASASTESCVAYVGCAKELVECSFDASIGHKLPPHWAQDTWDFFEGFLRG
jgi:poly(3-hydroxybutyrate) depolymerase